MSPEFTQRWKCKACGRVSVRTERRGKYSGNWHVGEFERRAKCSKCGAKGCEIEEILTSQLGTWLDPEAR